ncbi:MAG: phage major capsid protein, partial [Tyzzerella sp.]|nr:phage major capsid protein [Tyzzerella sp.]
KEISSAFKVVEITQCKLSAFAVIERDMLDLGPTFIDNYIRTFLKEALYCALEQGIISGNGLNMPIGLNRDIHKGVNFSTETGYPEKEAIAVTSFLPAEYGVVLTELATAESGRLRKFDEVTLVCNQVDYLKKIMPATTVLTAAGTYSRDLFPFPTSVVRSNEIETGKAIVFLPEEYFMGIGTTKDGKIEYSDEFKFLEDKRVFKIKIHAMGKAFDNTVAVVLDISNLEPAYITVLNKEAAAA